jgi:cytochrome c-type biogenesis protein CcmE
MRVPKFRIRTLMIAVAVLGIALGGLAGLQRMDQRMQRFRALAQHHQHRGLVNRLTVVGSVAHGDVKADTERYQIRAEYHDALNLKYKYAASHPWLPLSPDPPEPR